MRYVATQWVELMLRIMQNALSPHHLQDIDSMECAEDVLTTHLRFLISVLKQLDEFAQIFRHFPWRFRLLFDQVPAVVESTLKQMREEWEFLMVIEQNTVLHGKYPLNQMPFLRWYVYREVMTLAEERGWVASQDFWWIWPKHGFLTPAQLWDVKIRFEHCAWQRPDIKTTRKFAQKSFKLLPSSRSMRGTKSSNWPSSSPVTTMGFDLVRT